MARQEKKAKAIANPFYVLLVIAGVLFFITASAYGLMAFRGVSQAGVAQSPSPLMEYMDQKGAGLLAWEIAALAVFAVAAMATDSYFGSRPDSRKAVNEVPDTADHPQEPSKETLQKGPIA